MGTEVGTTLGIIDKSLTDGAVVTIITDGETDGVVGKAVGLTRPDGDAVGFSDGITVPLTLFVGETVDDNVIVGI